MKHSEQEAEDEDDTNGLWNGQPFKPLPAVDVPDLPAGCARAMSLQVCMASTLANTWPHTIFVTQTCLAHGSQSVLHMLLLMHACQTGRHRKPAHTRFEGVDTCLAWCACVHLLFGD